MEKGEHFPPLVGLQINSATMESRMEIPQEIKNGSNFLNGFSNPTSGNISEKMQNTNSKEHSMPMFIAALFTIVMIQKPPKFPSVGE